MTKEEAIMVLQREKDYVQQAIQKATDGDGYVSPDGLIRADDYVDACTEAISALRQHDVTDTNVGKNEPLTMDELREAAETGDPVWLVGAYRTDSWVVSERVMDDVLHKYVDYAEFGSDEPFYFKISDYGDLLKAYRQKPEEGTV